VADRGEANRVKQRKYSREQQVVMFSDIARFARLFVHEDDQKIDFVQRYYELSGDQIVEQGGRIVKYIGDAMLSVFPAGLEKAAVRCALDTERAFDDLVGELGLDPEVRLHTGINTGMVYTGVFGHRSLQGRDVFGNTVNEASIMTRGQGVCITEAVCKAIGDAFRTERLPDIQVKWQSVPIKAWRVIGD
jgi:class 3 adenylate cyclase